MFNENLNVIQLCEIAIIATVGAHESVTETAHNVNMN